MLHSEDKRESDGVSLEASLTGRAPWRAQVVVRAHTLVDEPGVC